MTIAHRSQIAINPAYSIKVSKDLNLAAERDTNLLLDRFGLALVGLSAHEDYNSVDGMPYIVSDSQLEAIQQGGIFASVRGALTGGGSDLSGLSAPEALTRATNIGASVVVLAQCVRETGLGVEFLEYSTLPDTNISGLFTSRGDDWGGSGSSFNGDIKKVYDRAVASYVEVYDMFNYEDRQQFLEHPLIPYRLATYINSYMKYTYGE